MTAFRQQPRAVAVIVDIVRSRDLDDRRRAQRSIVAAFRRVNENTATVQPLSASVGDEFQALYPTVPDALRAVLLARLALPPALDCRFGIAHGIAGQVGHGLTGALQDGSAWWLAREAIDEGHRREVGRTPTLRSWYRSDDEEDTPPEGITNAYLLARDHIVSGMSDRNRRLALGLLLGDGQASLAEQEGITQGAVSQSLRRSGASVLLAGLDTFPGSLAR